MEISNFELLRSGMDRELNILSENETENILGGSSFICEGYVYCDIYDTGSEQPGE